ncbi:MAG TPA: hypothetical protein VJ957_12380 [Longimicrobiales bacterium]|nr:hypothetical protein [Longimicrobiales bacterium]
MSNWKIAALAAALFAVSCGDHAAQSNEQRTERQPAAAGYSGRVVLSDSALTLSADSFPNGQVSLLIRNDGSQPELLRVDGPSYRYPPPDEAATMLVPGDSIVYYLHLAAGDYRLRVDGSRLPPTPFVVH